MESDCPIQRRGRVCVLVVSSIKTSHYLICSSSRRLSLSGCVVVLYFNKTNFLYFLELSVVSQVVFGCFSYKFQNKSCTIRVSTPFTWLTLQYSDTTRLGIVVNSALTHASANQIYQQNRSWLGFNRITRHQLHVKTSESTKPHRTTSFWSVGLCYCRIMNNSNNNSGSDFYSAMSHRQGCTHRALHTTNKTVYLKSHK